MKNSSLLPSILLIILFLSDASAQNQVLDSSFATNGLLVTDFGPAGHYGFDMAIQPDGKIIVVGIRRLSGAYQYPIHYRFNPDGSLDNSYNSSNVGVWGSGSQINAVVLQPDGKIVLAGQSPESGNPSSNLALARLLPNGLLDWKFTSSFYSNFTSKESLNAVAIQSDGKIVAVGEASSNSSQYYIVVLRYDGSSPVSTLIKKQFSVGGQSSARAHSVVIQPDGKIIVAGIAGASYPDGDFAMIRLNSNLTLDNTFGTGGSVFTNISGGSSTITKVILQPDGKIVVAGKPNNDVYTLARYNADGSLDNDFGVAGILNTGIYSGNFGPTSLLLQSDGKLLMGGSMPGDSTPFDFLLARFNTDGALDTSFGIQGKLTTDFGASDFIQALSFQPDGKIVASGYSDVGGVINLALARYISDLKVGVLDFSVTAYQALIYPNPIVQNATLAYTLQKEEIITLQLLDAQGKTLKNLISAQKQVAGEYQQTILMPEDLPTGHYFILLSTATGGRMTIKVVK